MRPKYKIDGYDPIMDIYVLKEHWFWFIYSQVSVGSRARLEKFIKENT